jgi:hypothetical protein
VPAYSWAKNPLATCDREKRLGYLDYFDEMKTDLKKVFPIRKKSVPPSSKYSKIVKWTDTTPNHCKVDKQARNTFIQAIFKKPKSPGPSTYKKNRDLKTCGSKFTGRVQLEQTGQT